MKITLSMAMSVNGIVTTETGNEDFLSHEVWEMFCKLAREFGNFVAGRKTYEAVQKWNSGYSFDDLIGVEKIIVSRDENFKLDKGYTLASSPEDALKKLSGKGFQKVLVAGGPHINSAFAKANLIDEIILNVEPVMVGKGISMFAPEDFEIKTKLISSEKSASGILTNHYEVLKS